MPEITRHGSRLDPAVAWTALTDAPLSGLALAREAGALLAWDEASHLLRLDLQGDRAAEGRVPGRILGAAIDDVGSLVAVLVEGPRLLLLDGALEPIADRPLASDSHALTVDPHGRYVAVASRSERTQIYTRYGRPAGQFETLQPLSLLRFVPDRPRLLGASPHGSLYAQALSPRGSAGMLDCEEVWRASLLSKIGRLEVTGNGGMILASCYTHGVQRFDSRGRNEGAYHLGGTVAHAVPDYPGRTIAVATTEGELSILNGAGNVRWKTGLPRGPVALECDALGRYVVYGLPSGEIVRLDLEAGPRRAGAGEPGEPARGPRMASGLRAPAWTVPLASSDEQAETTVLAVLDDLPRIAAITNSNRLQLWSTTGKAVGEAPPIHGVGRILRTAPGWVAAATDRQIVLHDARRNLSTRLDLSLVEVTHLKIRPDTYGLAIVQERDRPGRVTSAGRWVWKRTLRAAVEDLALGVDELTAMTTDEGLLLVFDAAGEPAGRYAAEPREPLALVEAPAGSPAGIAWLTLARQSQQLTGHYPDGRVAWRLPVPWEPWQLHALDALVVVEGLDGQTLAVNGAGHVQTQGRVETSFGLFTTGPSGEALRVLRQNENLICTDLSGRVRWRAISEEPLGPLAAGRSGVAALIGRSLAWFPNSGSQADGD